jgi:hypothetical protein
MGCCETAARSAKANRGKRQCTKIIDLTFVPWRRDRITRHYVERNGTTLEVPTQMTAAQLAAASTYCTTVDNPYALELTARAGTSRKFAEAEPDEKYVTLNEQKFGIRLF